MALSKRVRFSVLERDRFSCQYCGARPPDTILHVDHIHPRSKGGSDDPSNLITACWACNMGKHAKTGTESPDELRVLPLSQEATDCIQGLPGYAADVVFEACLGPRPEDLKKYVPGGVIFQHGWQNVLICLSWAMNAKQCDDLSAEDTWTEFRKMLGWLARGNSMEALIGVAEVAKELREEAQGEGD